MSTTGNPSPLFYQSGASLPLIDHAKGIRMWDTTGKAYIDGCSGSVICNIGHGDERVARAMAEQAAKASFAYRTHFNNQPALDLARKLIDQTPEHLDKVFYVSGGSEAVESAMKLCCQYFHATGQGERSLFIARRPSYHGATLGALALTSYAPLETPFLKMRQEYPKIPAPYCYRCPYGKTQPSCGIQCARALEETILEHGPEKVAAFVVEPVSGASVGALPAPEGYFDIIQETCRKYGVMLILDEVMSGFGRTGALFALEHWDVKPDILAISKGMASGYFPLGGILAPAAMTDAVMESGGFAHGHTYAGGPMACAVGNAVLDIILGDKLPENAAVRGETLKAGLEELAKRHPIIGEVRGKGLLLALEFVADRETREPFPTKTRLADRLAKIAYDLGLFIYPRRPINGLEGDHVLVAPPLILTDDDVTEILEKLDSALTKALEII